MSDARDYPAERHTTPPGQLGLHFGLLWASTVRLPHPGRQYIVAPRRLDGTADMANGLRDIWRDPVMADRWCDAMLAKYPDVDWHVWGRDITEFEIDEQFEDEGP
jgi:hypothetical protein